MSHTNRLAKQTSPYLLQHQHNPVDWYPWGPEAFDAARTQDKPIFLSVGYSTCYWCHVMERQSFENEAIARVMNDLFINIKVDREERPDVDQLYMTAVQVLTHHGGWPMSVFLLPDLRPFYGGTYFPPNDAHGRPGFVTVLRAIEDAYRNRRPDVYRSAEQIVNILQQLAKPAAPSDSINIDGDMLDQLVERSVSDFDPVHGGFGSAPKFPRQTLLELLLTTQSQISDFKSQIKNRKSQIPHMLRQTLNALANGGIRDHLGGGFHRYSTDAQWLVPHFEIMLYDNAMLGWIYVEASQLLSEPRYARVARGIFDFVLREMASPQGAFYTAFDAEVDAMEGASYLWTPEEITEVLRSDANAGVASFLKVYGVDRGPNFADPHHGSGRPDKNILYLPSGPEHEDDPPIVAARQKLYEARLKRKQPLLDTKILTSWNALMIRAMAHAGKVLNEPRYLDAATRAAEFLLREHQPSPGRLYRTSREGVKQYDGFLDDYSFLAQALLELAAATQDAKWTQHAERIADAMLEKFGAAGFVSVPGAGHGQDARGTGGFYFTSADAKDLIVRQMVGTDSPLPSGNAVAAMVMLELGREDVARSTLAAFAQQMQQQAEGMSAMVQAAMRYVQNHEEICVEPRGASESEADRPLSPTELAQRVVGIGIAWHDPESLEVKLQILNPFHINAHEASDGMIPAELTVLGTQPLAIEYPHGQDEPYGDRSIRVYHGQTSIMVRFAEAPKEPIRLSLRYQACDDSACLPEVRKEFTVTAPSRT